MELIKVAKADNACVVDTVICGFCVYRFSLNDGCQLNIFKNSRRFQKQNLNLPPAQATIDIALTLH